MMQSEERTRMHAFVDGSVQGVGFRIFVQDTARALGVTGWVRNTYKGKVEVLAEGTYHQLERLLEKLREGPSSAFVTEVKNEWKPASGEFKSFEIVRSV